MSAVFLDTSGVIALLHRGDVHHAQAIQLAERFRREQRTRLTTTAVLAELGDGFARKKRWDILGPFLTALLDDPLVNLVPVDGNLTRRAIDLRSARSDKDWGLTDCLSFGCMTDHGVPEALSADHHFQQAGFRALLLEPEA